MKMEAGSVVRAMFEFMPSVSEELPLFVGDVVEVCSVVDDFWLLGIKDGVTGQFPSTFVESVTIPTTRTGEQLYVCINDFSSSEQGCLSLKIGDVVAGEGGENGSWQRGRNAWGSLGLFPPSCVRTLELSGRSRRLNELSAAAMDSDLPPYALGRACALMSLHAQLDEELDFREGDVITIVGIPEPGWFQGELGGRRGLFPEGFVELLAPLRSLRAPDPVSLGCGHGVEGEDGGETLEERIREETERSKGGGDVEQWRHDSDEEDGVYGVALYDFRALESEELDFNAGDRIRILKTLEDGWLEGRLQGRTGILPHRFVKLEAHSGAPAPPVMGETRASKGDGEDIYVSEHTPNRHDHKDLEYCQESVCSAVHEDHTVWDLDYFERRERSREDSLRATGSQDEGKGNERQERPPAPALQSSRTANLAPMPLQRTNSGSPTPPRPKLPPRPSIHSLSNRQNRIIMPNLHPVPNTRSQSLKHSSRPSLGPQSSSLFCTSNDRRDLSSKSKRLTRHASANDADFEHPDRSARPRGRSSNGLPTSHTLDSLTGDLENKLAQQLVEFERSLPIKDEEQAGGDHLTNGSGKESPRHFSILDFNSETDIIRGSSRSSDQPSSSERRKTLRPPPPRPKVLRPPVQIYRPTRRAPRPPPSSRRQTASVLQEEDVEEHEDALERDRELNQERVRDQERCGRLLRLEEVERDIETYSNTAQELRAMLEEEGEEDEMFLQQTLENLEFCTYTLESLTLERQRLQGKE